ncbi:methyl-accepting chemotaxis protein [Ureibacillus manganicus]|uniref:methyl-accepting chemotaxis protein n=1 Tax=Ureibacillus manganicus TaxID=1266064 RepID=UPI00068E6D50|nr:HAMP domain-containing methyl-accepting chemotaxis protein [Ureibacillus manganicus]
MKKSIRTKLIVILTSIILLISITITSISLFSSMKLVEESVSQTAGSIVQNAVNVIDLDKYNEITLNSGETGYYIELREQLNDIRETGGLSYLYTMSREKVNDTYEYYYMVDGLPLEDDSASKLGDKEENIEEFEAIVNTFEEGAMQIEMSYTDEWGGMVSAYYPIKSESGEVIGLIGADIDVTSVYDKMFSSLRNLLILIIAIVLISSIIVSFVIYYMIKPLKSLTKQVEIVGKGNLTENIEVKRSDEIGALANAVNTMQQNLKNMIHNISKASDSVDSQSEALTVVSHEVQLANSQIAVTMQELASNMEKQSDSLSSLTNEMNTFAQKISEANDYGMEASVDSKEIQEFTIEGSHLMDTSMQKMQLINQTVSEAVKRVQELNVQTNEISSLVVVIQSIADQTNLLALNASIEAARAGEHGKGFAVVAEEVRKLAEQVSNSVQDIRKIAENIQSETKIVAQSLEAGYGLVEEGSNQIQTTGEAFHKIQTSVVSMVNKLENISGNLGNITKTSQVINQAVEDIATISETVVSGVEETTASIEESNASMKGILIRANNLEQLADGLNSEVKQFQVK